MNTLKQHIAQHRRAMRQLKEQERIARDFLLLCTPQSTIVNHQKAIAEMLRWQEHGSFESQGRTYPFRPQVLKAALLKMYNEPAFTPESTSNPDRPLRYLKKIMVHLIEMQSNQNQAAGVQVHSEASTASTMSTPPSTFVEAWCKHALDGLHKVHGLDVGVLIARVEAMLTDPQQFQDSLPAALEEMLFVQARERLGEKRLSALRREVESWFAEHKAEWSSTVFEEAVEEGLRARLREYFRLPQLMS